MYRSRLAGLAMLAATALTACVAPQAAPAPPPAAVVPATDIDQFAQRFLDQLQPLSISQGREYCGNFIKRVDGTLAATPPVRGTADGCAYQVAETAVATYHTHGRYLPNYLNEIPSSVDITSARAFLLDDYVSTPGGRLWRIDGQTGVADLICGARCVTTDPMFVPGRNDPRATRYTVAELRRIERGFR
ncbi:DUF4329 domain-containing protein [Yoonia sp. SS1-5]|uniref:DUF4329 domain-containing protein n=1 Tax=Yoonia rhodophyticola TaxID=3137370 RepID=A0AAN0NHV4_9RHOB